MTSLPLAWASAIVDSSVKGWMRCIDNLDCIDDLDDLDDLDYLDVLEKKNDEYIIKYTNNY
jgi:hypothetical protein